MKKWILALGLVAAAGMAQASCIGSSSFSSCTDDRGNNYDVSRFGNTTYVQGRNSGTGSTWSQTSQSVGSTTFHSGTASDGRSWSGTTQSSGGTNYYSGTDSRGNSYSGSSGYRR